MATFYHLYDPTTDTHYSNGGYTTAIDLPSGLQLIEGNPPEGAIQYIDSTSATAVSKTIKEKVAQIAINESAVLLRYSGEIGLINDFLNEANLPGAVGLLKGLVEIMGNASDTAALNASQPVLDYLTSIGVYSND